ncbi:Lon protease family protein [Motiliproteus sp. MSK22-1]|uniref:Lon protease family protein n=1 Tax=Motiliproteus sp. MSK22-1 TaxID=1897630 RepID=UPI0009755FAD|nr:AAA family ATPase [Motiliproteus sp. MSK22-1]OMH39471.1 ATP-dependent protease [Motiliproteus sp. MSK22-1]
MEDEKRLSAEQLYHSCNPELLPFKTTETLESFSGIYGQERAIGAMEFGIGMRRPDYNMFVMGHSQSGRFSFVMETLKREAKRDKKPRDWCYLNNLEDPRYPQSFQFAPGKAAAFHNDIKHLLESLSAELPSAFENPSYQRQKSRIDRDFNRLYDQALERVENQARSKSIALYREAGSVGFTPVADGQVMDEAAFSQLSEEERNKVNSDISSLEDYLNESLTSLPQWRREMNEKLKKLEHDTTRQAIVPTLQSLREKYSAHSKVVNYLSQLEADLVKGAVELVGEDKLGEVKGDASRRAILEQQYGVNLLVSHQKTKGAPVIFESHPNYENLFGRVEYTTDMGAMVTNFQLIRGGSLHQANGGYLILEAEKLFEHPMVWSALKRALKSKELRIENPFAELAGISTITLSPEPIPLRVKVVIIGGRDLYYLLQQMDSDFSKLFRVVVDFDEDVPRTDASIRNYARLMKTLAMQEKCAHLNRKAVARLIEHSSRMAEDQDLLSAHIGEMMDLICEADYKRQRSGEELIQDVHIEQALEAKELRTNRLSTKMRSEILNEVVLIKTEGEAVGQSNGLTVLQVGDVSFGTPARITATVHPGDRGIVDIEKEVTLGQPIHSKGVLILSGYLGHKYAQDFPISLSASIALEQSYGHVDGDSASLAEICTLISALTHTPIKQSFALTGSINQYGEVQAIGGVNEKIEGFFDVCVSKGLTGEQGVIIPRANQRNLMLKRSVVDAVSEGLFCIHIVASVDQALELLTGRKAGVLKTDGTFTQRSLNHQVVKRLKELYKAKS